MAGINYRKLDCDEIEDRRDANDYTSRSFEKSLSDERTNEDYDTRRREYGEETEEERRKPPKRWSLKDLHLI